MRHRRKGALEIEEDRSRCFNIADRSTDRRRLKFQDVIVYRAILYEATLLLSHCPFRELA